MRPWLLLALVACRGTTEGPPLVLTLEEAEWGSGAVPVADAEITVESRRGAPVYAGLTDEAGKLTIEVDWSQQPFALTAVHPEQAAWYSLTGIHEWQAETTLHIEREREEERVLVTGQVANRTEGTFLIAVTLAPGGAVFAIDTDAYAVTVAPTEPFTLLLAEATTVWDGQTVLHPLDGWRFAAHPGVTETTWWDLDLATMEVGEEQSHSLEVLLPSAAEANGKLAFVQVLSGNSGFRSPCGWTEYSGTLGSTGFETDVAWVQAIEGDPLATWVTAGLDSSSASCLLQGPPDEVEVPVLLPPQPQLQDSLDLGAPLVFTNLPELWYPRLEVESTAADWTWTIHSTPDWGEKGWMEVWIPTPPPADHRGEVRVTPGIVDRLAYDDPRFPEICSSQTGTVLVEVEPW